MINKLCEISWWDEMSFPKHFHQRWEWNYAKELSVSECPGTIFNRGSLLKNLTSCSSLKSKSHDELNHFPKRFHQCLEPTGIDKQWFLNVPVPFSVAGSWSEINDQDDLQFIAESQNEMKWVSPNAAGDARNVTSQWKYGSLNVLVPFLTGGLCGKNRH